MSAAKLDRGRTALVVIDIQEAFAKALPDFDAVAEAGAKLVKGASILGVPIHVTEQYPKGLGHTVEAVADHLPDGVTPLEKSEFSACAAQGFDLDGRDQALVCGIETHVCVNQTVLDLVDQGVEVHICTDAVGSRTAENRDLGLRKAERSGAWLTSVETALFELLGGAGAQGFKEIQGLVK